ncbi:hypothetical protein PSTG_03795 [Puccinia striiformis f. sp. tritici PST-78]|uniref:mannan endo-1,4-beta-mannosidase n=2 Tax=Puccinia striiformis f. sp. tritici TaxID=168172 RepID=A0A0L0VU97_9BASI|nr:hypothetical protein PSTG_03795 [Puccinia striiformis f. sp. tritici PST-78]
MAIMQAGYLPWGLCLLWLVIGSVADSQAATRAKHGSLSAHAHSSASPLPNRLSHAKLRLALESKDEFVSAPGDGHLYLKDRLFDFRSFNTPTLFDGDEFQGRDLIQTIAAFGSPVTRTYTLHVANNMFSDGVQPPSSSHIIGWDEESSNWIYNEDIWRKMDQMLDLSRKHGVRLIIPIINQDYGGSGTNWVGNFNDLIRHRYDIQGYAAANHAVDWFTDREMISSYKQLITFFLNRINTYNGIRIGDDPTILAFETGNEMNWGSKKQTIHRRPAPASWTIEIAKHIKSLAPKTLVMDGSFARNPEAAWEEEVLDSPYVDLYSYHLYGTGDTEFYQILQDQVQAHGKTFVLGEHGFYAEAETYGAFYEQISCAGAFVWSMLPHSENGGFLTHGEGKNIYAYHAPGFEVQTSSNFDTHEAEVISSTYDASYTILGLEPPPKPVPGPPEAFLVKNGEQVGIVWRGSAWAQKYQILGAFSQDESWSVISKNIPDNVEAGQLFVPLDRSEPTKRIRLASPTPIPERSHAGYIDSKWCVPGSATFCPTTLNSSTQAGTVPRNSASNPTQHSIVTKRIYSAHPQISFQGNWFAVRAISAQGVLGGVSEPVFLGV